MKKIFISLFLSGVFMYHTNAQTAVEGPSGSVREEQPR